MAAPLTCLPPALRFATYIRLAFKVSLRDDLSGYVAKVDSSVILPHVVALRSSIILAGVAILEAVPVMSTMTATKTTPKRNGSTSKTFVTVPTPVPISPAVQFPTPATPTRHLFRTPITISTGPRSKPFPIHLEILLTISPFFAAAYNPSYTFRDSPASQPVTSSTSYSHASSPSSSSAFSNLTLPSINPEDFEYFIQWLYTRTLDHEDLSGPHPAYFKLIRLYGLADQLQITALKNKIVDELGMVADRTNSCPTPDDTRTVWNDESGCAAGSSSLDRYYRRSRGGSVSEDSGSTSVASSEERQVGTAALIGAGGGEGGLRELISDLFAWKKTDRLIAEHADQWDERFLREVVVKLKREMMKGDKAPWREKGKACRRYHTHDEWAPTCDGIAKGE